MKLFYALMAFLFILAVSAFVNQKEDVRTETQKTAEVQSLLEDLSHLKKGDIIQVNHRSGRIFYLMVTEVKQHQPDMYQVIGRREKTAYPTSGIEDLIFHTDTKRLVESTVWRHFKFFSPGDSQYAAIKHVQFN